MEVLVLVIMIETCKQIRQSFCAYDGSTWRSSDRKTVGEADRMYYFERSARIYITALQTGQKLKTASHEIAEKTAQQSDNYFSDLHFKAILEVLDEEEPDYLN